MPRHLAVELQAQREAIAAWAAQAIPGLVARGGYVQPASGATMVEALANDLNSVRFFLSRPDFCKLDPEAHTTEAALYERFWKFSTVTEGCRPPAPKTFRRMIDNLTAELDISQDTIRDPKTGFPVAIYRGVELVA